MAVTGVVVASGDGAVGTPGVVTETAIRKRGAADVVPDRVGPECASDALGGGGRSVPASGTGRVERGGADVRPLSEAPSFEVPLLPLDSGAERAMPSGENHLALSGVRFVPLVGATPVTGADVVRVSFEAVAMPEPGLGDASRGGRLLLVTVLGGQPDAGSAAARLGSTSFVLSR